MDTTKAARRLLGIPRKAARHILGLYLVVLCAGGLVATIQLWPAVDEAASDPKAESTTVEESTDDPDGAATDPPGQSSTTVEESTDDPDGAATDPPDQSSTTVEESTDDPDGAGTAEPSEPSTNSACGTSEQENFKTHMLWFDMCTSSAQTILVFVSILGMVGASIKGIRALASHVAAKDFDNSYGWWYLIRPLIGAALALVVYLTLIAGLLGLSNPDQTVNAWGAGALGALTGLFAKEAIGKLSDLAHTAFGTDEPKKDGVEPKPESAS